ncbi:hypothetical protein IV203_033475 [Nitzschia inconspicua]|uniref:Uncharacterized protein n=1 Tax=Nitzschia inconspicua TaxID=303405 RepID=A0A9K3K4M1_9STRA|nr:hypothetical protein IV203_033475 [Nitzschia inconspicua]
MGEESTEQEQPDSKNKLPTYPLALDCRNYERIIHKEDVFSGILRDALIQSKLDLERSLPEFLERPFYNGMLIQYEVKDDPIHGRGLYTTQDLPEELQCDVMLWSYPVKDSDREVYLAMDEGSYMNDGGIKDSNIGGNETTTIRDIKAGEHLAENYYEYIDFEGNVKWFHDLRERVFGSGKYTEQGAPPQPIKQNDYHKMLRTDTTSTFTASAVDYLFREMDVLVESSNRMNMTSIITLSFLVVAAFLTKRRVLFKDKLHGL